MEINPYEPSQVPPDRPPSIPLRFRLYAVVFCIAGGAIATWGIFKIVQRCDWIISGIVPQSDIYPTILVALMVPTMGVGILLLGIDMWRGTKRFAKISAVLLAPFAFALVFSVFALIFMLIVTAITGWDF